jgi:hypothetical protein
LKLQNTRDKQKILETHRNRKEKIKNAIDLLNNTEVGGQDDAFKILTEMFSKS